MLDETPLRGATPPTLRRVAGLAAISLLAAAAALAPLPARADPYRTVSADQVQRMIGAGDVRVLDANSADVYAKSHLPGAVHIGARSLASLLPADKAARLVFYCANPG
jgi:hypothetical protein